MRQFVRHPADVPLSVETETVQSPQVPGRVANVGFGGLAFEARRAFPPGTTLRMRVPSVEPGFEFWGRTVWCRESGTHFSVGVEFLEPEKLFKARLVEQMSLIEHYRNEVRRTEGRDISGDQAAQEWIKKHAAEFPAIEA